MHACNTEMFTLWAITPSLSSSANRLMSSKSFSLCFFEACVQLTYNGTMGLYCIANQNFTHFTERKASSKWKSVKVKKVAKKKNPVNPTWKHSNRWSSCSGEKSQASLASKSCTFFTMASCFPDYKEQISVNVSVHQEATSLINIVTTLGD